MTTAGIGSDGNDSALPPPPRLSEFLQSVRSTGSEAASGELDTILMDIVDAAQRACPTVDLSPEVFVAYLCERLPADVPWAVALRQMHTSDLYLACACARGDAQALAVFDQRCVSQLDGTFRKMGIGDDVSAEVKQDIRSRVLVGGHGEPEITEFSGRGDLRGWVRVMAVRLALRRQARGRREVALEDDELLQKVVAPGDPQLDYAKDRYRQEFERAFDAALRALTDRERTLLRQHYVDGLTIDELGKLYRTHRSTAARLLARARARVLEATRAWMMSQLEVHTQDLDSILRMIRSQLDVSLRGLERGRRR